MIEAPGWVLFSYTLLRKEPRIIPRQPPESIGSIYSIPIDQLHPHPDNPFGNVTFHISAQRQKRKKAAAGQLLFMPKNPPRRL